MEKNIAKSPEILAKEAKIKDLQKTLKKRKTVLKSLKTRLKNTKADIENTQRTIQSLLFSKMEKLDTLRMEIGNLALKMKDNKQFSKADRKALDEMSQEFLDGTIFRDQFEEIQEAKRKQKEGDFDFDENFRAKMNDAFAQFRVAPEEKEQRDIRKVFIKLSRKFHPDLAENEQQAVEFHSMMQQINQAYKANDIHTLLEMEQLYLLEELDFVATSITIDVLQQEIERLERDVNFINGQVDRTSLEIKQLRQSDMGEMLTGIKKANRQGEGIEAMEAEFDEMIAQMEQLKAGFADSLERGSISPILVRMMNPFAGLMDGDMPMPNSEEEAISMLNDMFSMLGEDFEDEDEYEENENPKFPLHSPVKVVADIPHFFDIKLSMKGWQGWIDEAYIDEEGDAMYKVMFDSKAMNAMPKALLKTAIDEEEDFQMFEFYEEHLQATTEIESEEEAFETYRKLRVHTEWSMLISEEYVDFATSIFLADMKKDNQTNLEDYLNASMPFKAKGKGRFELKRNKAVTVKQVYGFNTNVGFTVLIQEKGKKRPFEYPLMDLIPDTHKMKRVVEIHDIWFEDIYENEDEGFFGFF